MKIATYTAVALLVSVGYAFAADTNSGTSGRPSAVLTDKQCQDAWIKAKGSNDALISPKEGKGILINFQQADTNRDGKVTEDEFKNACKVGLVHSAANNM
jgi:EF hand